MSQPKTVIAFDPGLITGVASGTFTESTPLELTDSGAITYQELLDGFGIILETEPDFVVAEKFESRSDQGFAPDLSSLRVEGLLDLAFQQDVVWRSPSKKSQVPDDLLREHGLWKTGSDVEWEDGRDVNDAIIHLIGFVAFDLRHVPTIRKYFKPNYAKAELR